MGVVGFALRFPHTFYVLAILAIFLGGFAILITPADIFPRINIPVVTVIWQYTGLTPHEMEPRTWIWAPRRPRWRRWSNRRQPNSRPVTGSSCAARSRTWTRRSSA